MPVYCAACNSEFSNSSDLARHHFFRRDCISFINSLNLENLTHHLHMPTNEPTNSPEQPELDPPMPGLESIFADGPDSDATEDGTHSGPIRYRDVCPTAGYIYGTSEPVYHQIRREQLAKNEPVTAGFKDAAEFKLAKWLQDNQVSQNARAEFFDLETTQRMGLSYTSNFTLNNRVDDLPKGPEWTSWTQVLVGDQKDSSGKLRTESVTMLKRDLMETVAQLVNDPTNRDSMVFAPEQAFLDAGKTCRVYEGVETGTAWERVQSELPEGATVVPIILSSDKTHLTNQQGCKEAWPVYISTANVTEPTRSKVSSGATILLGQLPVTDLEIYGKDRRGKEV
ncbi:hypothetical protein FRC09_010541 [Ceratobasidium sp. 395]|nr:hypothetical protein FRC09_010541 [Ceratobasidium sp. 395]